MTILHTNDFHGGLTPERFEDLKRLRAGSDVYFDCGDAVTYGNVAVPLAPDPVWPRLTELGCDASVPGNREFHVLAPVFTSKMKGWRIRWSAPISSVARVRSSIPPRGPSCVRERASASSGGWCRW